ncbi:hypothetical protein B0H16DRAFT_1465734 [Mycena metata]|uniref:Uncharacterized protein n=1 Tax=Mycena metata TaxID=1033252 RepID=A0AAD7IAF5_9AGAR|nr:hypothetical protein B0H16DRAFT_1465734 [Mycena metata]
MNSYCEEEKVGELVIWVAKDYGSQNRLNGQNSPILSQIDENEPFEQLSALLQRSTRVQKSGVTSVTLESHLRTKTEMAHYLAENSTPGGFWDMQVAKPDEEELQRARAARRDVQTVFVAAGSSGSRMWPQVALEWDYAPETVDKLTRAFAHATSDDAQTMQRSRYRARTASDERSARRKVTGKAKAGRRRGMWVRGDIEMRCIWIKEIRRSERGRLLRERSTAARWQDNPKGGEGGVDPFISGADGERHPFVPSLAEEGQAEHITVCFLGDPLYFLSGPTSWAVSATVPLPKWALIRAKTGNSWLSIKVVNAAKFFRTDKDFGNPNSCKDRWTLTAGFSL